MSKFTKLTKKDVSSKNVDDDKMVTTMNLGANFERFDNQHLYLSLFSIYISFSSVGDFSEEEIVDRLAVNFMTGKCYLDWSNDTPFWCERIMEFDFVFILQDFMGMDLLTATLVAEDAQERVAPEVDEIKDRHIKQHEKNLKELKRLDKTIIDGLTKTS